MTRHAVTAAILALALSAAGLGPARAEDPAEIRAHTAWLLEMMALTGGVFVRREGGRSGLIADAKNALADKMRDPGSVQWRNVRVVDYDGGHLVCGEYNAKNAFGGYVGYRVFAASNTVVRLESRNQDREVAAAVNEPLFDVCGR